MKIKFEEYGNPTDILIAPELAFAIPCIVSNEGVEENSESKKIIKAGTPLVASENPYMERQTILKIYTGNDSSPCYGYARWDIDVTNGNQNGTMLVAGYVDRLKLSGDVLNYISALSMDSSVKNHSNVLFLSGRTNIQSNNVYDGNQLLNALTNGGNVTLSSNISTDSRITISSNSAIQLNNKKVTLSVDDGKPAAIWVKDGATLSVSGDGIVNAESYVFDIGGKVYKPNGEALNAHTSATIIINGGDYTTNSASIVQVEYGEAYIQGGTFKLSDDAISQGWAKYTLNCIDNQGGKITVTGGKFYKFDPSKDNGTEVTVPTGYKVVKDGDWYTVVAE